MIAKVRARSKKPSVAELSSGSKAAARKTSYGPIKVRRIFEEVCAQIRAHIASGVLKPGDKLPAERELAVQFGVGRAAVREALRSLENSGIVHLQKGVQGGAFIQHLSPSIVSTSMRDLVYLGNVSLDMLTEARVLINDPVIRLVCKRATEEELASLEANIDRTEAAATLPERLAHTRQFYRLLGAATRNNLVMTIVDSMAEVVMDFVETVTPLPMRDVAKSRRKLVRLIRDGDEERAVKEAAAQLEQMHQHLINSRP